MTLTGGPAIVPGRRGAPYQWEIVRYKEARWALSADCFAKDPHRAWRALGYDAFVTDRSFPVETTLNLANSDPPAHTRLRSFLATYLTAGRIKAMAPLIASTARHLIDSLLPAANEVVDLVDAFIFPLQVTVICELLGIPHDRRSTYRSLAATLAASPAGRHEGDTPNQNAFSTMGVFIAEALATKRTAQPASYDAPEPDLLSALVRDRQHAGTLTPEEIQSLAMLLITAGQDPTIVLIADGLSTLLQHPDQLRLFREQANVRPQAIEELLRYRVPVSPLPRIVARPIEIDGVHLSPGDIVGIDLEAAHRDPDQFHHPGNLDITRQPNPHLSFGRGIHHCIGAPLARLLADTSLTLLLTRFPQITLVPALDAMHAEPARNEEGMRTLTVVLGCPDAPES